jgi:hypothetical protein
MDEKMLAFSTALQCFSNTFSKMKKDLAELQYRASMLETCSEAFSKEKANYIKGLEDQSIHIQDELYALRKFLRAK